KFIHLFGILPSRNHIILTIEEEIGRIILLSRHEDRCDEAASQSRTWLSFQFCFLSSLHDGGAVGSTSVALLEEKQEGLDGGHGSSLQCSFSSTQICSEEHGKVHSVLLETHPGTGLQGGAKHVVI
ncbi:hypothetical protein PENTCL1PPCAC_15937, partial [Pristionchus entomophagus]